MESAVLCSSEEGVGVEGLGFEGFVLSEAHSQGQGTFQRNQFHHFLWLLEIQWVC